MGTGPMQRRDFLSQLAAACAGAPLLLPDLSFAGTYHVARASHAADMESARGFPTERIRMIEDLAEGIIPATDTPGAKGAGVPEFLELLYSEWCLPEQQARFEAGLIALDANAIGQYGRDFVQLSRDEQLALLRRWDDEAFETPPATAAGEFFRWFKNLTIIGYYTSEVGQMQELKVRFGSGQDTPAGPILQPPPFRT
jgi:Gluconate 2-dehydrogenase subunit 3